MLDDYLQPPRLHRDLYPVDVVPEDLAVDVEMHPYTTRGTRARISATTS